MNSDRIAERSYFAPLDSAYNFVIALYGSVFATLHDEDTGQAMVHRAVYGALHLIGRSFSAGMLIPAGVVRVSANQPSEVRSVLPE